MSFINVLQRIDNLTAILFANNWVMIFIGVHNIVAMDTHNQIITSTLGLFNHV